MKEIVAIWFLRPAQWWQFWLPQSGKYGGLIAGSVISAALWWARS